MDECFTFKPNIQSNNDDDENADNKKIEM